MDTVICGLQQVGIGVTDARKAYNWYINAFGVTFMACDAKGVAERMLPYTGNKPRPRRAILAVNVKGGGGFEVWEPKNEIHPAPQLTLGDLGINVCRVKTDNIIKALNHFNGLEGATVLGTVAEAPDGQKHFFITDPYGNLFDIVEDGYVFCNTGFPTGGSDGAMIGVSDMDKSVDFYSKMLGLDKILCDETAVFDDLAPVNGGKGCFRRVKLTSSSYGEGPLGAIYGPYTIELIQSLDREPVKIFEGRWWGDPGFIQICLDIRNMEGIHQRALSLGHDFVCDGGEDFSMGDADGHFTYVVDPDDTMIEFVETKRIPIAKKLGLVIDLTGKDPHKNLPAAILKALRFVKTTSLEA